MKNLIKLLLSTIVALSIVSCGGVNETETADSSEAATEISPVRIPAGLKVEYSSIDALNASAYDSTAEWGSPLALGDGLANSMNGFPIVDVGAYPDNGKMIYDILIVNQSSDTVTIETIKLPGNSMEVNWEGRLTYKPGLLGKIQLRSDSAINSDDFRFILTYKDNKYPPQTFHINLRPDIHKLIAEREAQ